MCRERNVRYVVDATQAAASLPIDVDGLQADVMGISAHKIEGPKGVGALFIRQGTNLIPQQSGGSQERQRRAGTENVAGAVGLAAALRLARDPESGTATEADRLRGLRDRLISRLAEISDGELTGHPTARLPNSASCAFDGVEGGDLVAAARSRRRGRVDRQRLHLGQRRTEPCPGGHGRTRRSAFADRCA